MISEERLKVAIDRWEKIEPDLRCMFPMEEECAEFARGLLEIRELIPNPDGIPEAVRLLKCIATADDGQGCGAHQHDDISNAEYALKAIGVKP